MLNKFLLWDWLNYHMLSGVFFISGALYICTEGAFPNRRLHQMAQHFSQLYGSVLKHHVMDHIFVEHVADFVSVLFYPCNLHMD